MKTIKEITLELNEEIEINRAYIQWYNDALEWVSNDIVNAEVTSVEIIQKILQDLIK